MKFENFWYFVAQSEQLKSHQVLSRQVLGEWLAIFRGANGQAIASGKDPHLLPDKTVDVKFWV
ncbi:MAG TPA: Rieske 2Fe-2S domain-containing protein [Kamptonema sp.]|nr:Rieske 2Fe-2S domain-containing protein [Kamptonema sp.]